MVDGPSRTVQVRLFLDAILHFLTLSSAQLRGTEQRAGMIDGLQAPAGCDHVPGSALWSVKYHGPLFLMMNSGDCDCRLIRAAQGYVPCFLHT